MTSTQSSRIQIALEVRKALSEWRRDKPLAFSTPTHPTTRKEVKS